MKYFQQYFYILLFCLLILLQSCNSKSNSAKSTSIFQPPTPEEMHANEMERERDSETMDKELRIIRDLEKGMKLAKEENKPIALIFTGFAVVNSRKLEQFLILENDEIFSLLKNNYINVWLYVDKRGGDGEKWTHLQKTKFKGNFLPQIFIVDPSGNEVDGGFGYDRAKDEFLPLLQKNANLKF
jgi:hypothetical protein